MAEADELVGYGLYIDLLGPLAAGKTRSDFPLGGEEAAAATRWSGRGRAGTWRLSVPAMPGSMPWARWSSSCSIAARPSKGVGCGAPGRGDLRPGVSALQAAAARAGAPLGHDFCTISLSDLLTRALTSCAGCGRLRKGIS